jgi:hypothetical protein
MTTRRIHRNLAPAINHGRTDQILGLRVAFVGYDGTERTGVIARIQGLDPIAELTDGTWARLDAADVVEVR